MRTAFAIAAALGVLFAAREAMSLGFLSGIINRPGGPTLFLSMAGPGRGPPGVPSTTFTFTLVGATFNGTTNTVTLSDGGAGGTFTPSVGAPGPSPKVVTPAAAATSFTFTYTPAVTASAAVTFTFSNSAGWPMFPPTFTYLITCSNSFNFSQACNSQYLGFL